MRKCCFAIVTLTFLAPVPVSAAETVVTMAGAAYSPAKVSASVGDTIRFVNNGDMNHVVFVPTAGFSVDLGKQEPGSEKVLTLGKAGKFEVECVIHPDMLTVVEVK